MRYLPRHLEARIELAARHFKVIFLTGARQTGKSTLLAHLFPHVKMITFDPVQDLYDARRDPDLFLDHFPPPLILDEIQYAPELFPAIKRRVDLSPATGQYFLTGSQQFGLLKDISESLAGRAISLHLSSFTPAEEAGKGKAAPRLQDWLQRPAQACEIFQPAESQKKILSPILWRGTLPGTRTLPDALIPDYFRSYAETYIDRDIRRMGQIRETQEFARFVNLSGALTACEINASQLGRDIGISPSTAQQWLAMLSACYQWREIPAYHGNAIKRVASKAKGYITDTGLACWLQRLSSPDALAASPMLGRIFETFVAHVLLAQAGALALAPLAWHWRTAGGAEIDLLFERDGLLYPVEMKCSTLLHGHDTRGIQALKKTYGDKVQPGLIVYAGKECRPVNEYATAVPWFGL